MRMKFTFAAALMIVGAAWLMPVFTPGPVGAAESPQLERKGFFSVNPLEAKEMIESRDDLLVVDVRSQEEYVQGALPGSTLVPFWEIMRGNHSLPKNKPILLVCAVGGRSLAVGKFLALKGYSEVANLSGGLAAWARQGVPLPQH